jgi:hypothetical protein
MTVDYYKYVIIILDESKEVPSDIEDIMNYGEMGVSQTLCKLQNDVK